MVLTPVLLVICIVVVRVLWYLPPVVPLCGAIVLTMFSNGWALIGLHNIPLNRLLVLIVFLQFALKAPGIAQIPRPQIRNVHFIMALTVLYVLGSSVWSGTFGTTNGFYSLTDILGIVPFGLYFLAPAIFVGERERNLLLATLVGLGLYLGVTAIFETFGPHSLVFPSYISHTDHSETGVVQVSGPFQSPVAEGFATFACAVASVMAFLYWRGRRERILAVAAGALSAFACFATLERGVWIATAIAIVSGTLGTRTGRRVLAPGALLCAIAVGVLLTLSAQISHNTSERVGDSLSVWDRENQTATGLRMVLAKPILGFGWERYQSGSAEYFRQPATYPMTGHTRGVTIGVPEEILPLHDTYLSYAVELGLVGLLLWLTSLVMAIWGGVASPGTKSLRPWKLGLVPVAVFFLVVSFFDPHQQPFPTLLLLVWSGVAIGGNSVLGQRRLIGEATSPAQHLPMAAMAARG